VADFFTAMPVGSDFVRFCSQPKPTGPMKGVDDYNQAAARPAGRRPPSAPSESIRGPLSPSHRQQEAVWPTFRWPDDHRVGSWFICRSSSRSHCLPSFPLTSNGYKWSKSRRTVATTFWISMVGTPPSTWSVTQPTAAPRLGSRGWP